MADRTSCRIGFNRAQDFVRNLEDRHFGQQIVSRDFRRGHEQAAFAVELALGTAVEKVRDVGVLLSFSEAVIAHARAGEYVCENVVAL